MFNKCFSWCSMCNFQNACNDIIFVRNFKNEKIMHGNMVPNFHYVWLDTLLQGRMKVKGPFWRSYECIWTFWDHGHTRSILAIANTKKIPGCYVSRCYVGSCGGNIVSGVHERGWPVKRARTCTCIGLRLSSCDQHNGSLAKTTHWTTDHN